MPKLDAIAPIVWVKWGGTVLNASHEEALDAADGLAFRAMNSGAGIRTLLIVCTTNLAQIQAIEEALTPGTITRPVDWQNYSVAEMVFKTEKGSGLGYQERRNESGRSALVLCATRPTSVQTLEGLLGLPE